MDKDTKTTELKKDTLHGREVIKKEGASTLETVTKGMTRIYDVTEKETRIIPRHKWIGDDGQETNDMTRIMDLSTARMPKEEILPDDEQKSISERLAGTAKSVSGAAKKAASSASAVGRDLKRVKVADSVRFGRFLKVVGVFALILILELCWLKFASHVKGMPDDIAKAQSELELTKKECAILDEENKAARESGTTEEQKQSWEKLRDRVRKAEEETSS